MWWLVQGPIPLNVDSVCAESAHLPDEAIVTLLSRQEGLVAAKLATAAPLALETATRFSLSRR
jgi:hypothetical protein